MYLKVINPLKRMTVAVKPTMMIRKIALSVISIRTFEKKQSHRNCHLYPIGKKKIVFNQNSTHNQPYIETMVERFLCNRHTVPDWNLIFFRFTGTKFKEVMRNWQWRRKIILTILRTYRWYTFKIKGTNGNVLDRNF